MIIGNVPSYPCAILKKRTVKSRPTIIDVAERAGVSKSTVSRVVADDGQGVSEKAKKRVQQAIEALGYVPNAIASSMRTARTNTIMLAIPDITNPFWPEVARGVQDVMDEEGLAVVFANSDWDKRREESYLAMARRNRFDGLLINPVEIGNDILAGSGIPTIVLGAGNEYPDFDRVGADSYAATQIALDHLFALGHRRIGLILGERHSPSRDSRLAGYNDFFHRQQLPVETNLITTVSFTENGGEVGLKRLLAQTSAPTAVFCANDVIAIGALHAAHAAGLHVPGDLSIVGLDDIYAAATTSPPLTTVAKPKYEIGRQAAMFLLERIVGEGPEMPRRLLLAGRLQVRGSTASPRENV